MSKDKRELPEERLGSLDNRGGRIAPHPAQVTGPLRDWRNRVYFILIIFFLVLPWVTYEGHQLVLLNIPERKFSLFGLHFWAHDVPMTFFVFAILTLGLAFVTSVWGRVWCGWACPQTVFIDFIYRRIEKFVEGNHIQQLRLSKMPWNFEKIRKFVVKWSLYFLVSLVIAHSFLAYFVGSHRVLEMMQSLPTENWTSFLVVFFVTFVILFDFGWMREQFCIIMCPYGRFQSVLMDESSMNIMYDEGRGEPRKGTVEKGQEGDCINCFKCVAVCPTGIDIRRGTQMECIACTACIDVCDEVMEKIKKPKGLIRYDSIVGLSGGGKFHFFKWRTLIYLTLILISVTGLVTSLANRKDLDISFIRAIEEPYKTAQVNGEPIVTNHFKVHLKNQSFDEAIVTLVLNAENIELISPTYPLTIASGENAKNHIFLKFKKQVTGGKGQLRVPVKVKIKLKNKELTYDKELTLVGPII